MKPAQQRRLITRRNRALTRFSIIEVPDGDGENVPRRRYIVTLILLTLAIVAGLLNLMP